MCKNWRRGRAWYGTAPTRGLPGRGWARIQLRKAMGGRSSVPFFERESLGTKLDTFPHSLLHVPLCVVILIFIFMPVCKNFIPRYIPTNLKILSTCIYIISQIYFSTVNLVTLTLTFQWHMQRGSVTGSHTPAKDASTSSLHFVPMTPMNDFQPSKLWGTHTSKI